ncbi:MAG: GNAT family N-acetyltransferase [Actinomycetota bacterium]|nr:GNAT family N-acetyltransferase [Actinomycetota bacterium]
MTVEIRPARLSDDADLAALDLRGWTPVAEVGPARAPGSDFFGPGQAPADVLVAEEGGTLVGWIKLVPPTALVSNAHVQQVQGLGVDPRRRRSGIGRALVDAVVGLAVRRGARKVTLRVLSTNGAAQRLYTSAGFTVEGVLVAEFHLGGVDVDDVLMARFVG